MIVAVKLAVETAPRIGSALVRSCVSEAGHDDVFQPAVARLLDSLRSRPPRLRVSFGTCGSSFEP